MPPNLILTALFGASIATSAGAEREIEFGRTVVSLDADEGQSVSFRLVPRSAGRIVIKITAAPAVPFRVELESVLVDERVARADHLVAGADGIEIDAAADDDLLLTFSASDAPATSLTIDAYDAQRVREAHTRGAQLLRKPRTATAELEANVPTVIAELLALPSVFQDTTTLVQLAELSFLAHEIGQIPTALKASEHAYALCGRFAQSSAVTTSRSTVIAVLMGCLMHVQDFRRAREIGEAALLWPAPDMDPDYLLALRQNLATCFTHLGEARRARELRQEILTSLAGAAANQVDLLQAARLNLASSHAELGEFAMATQLVDQVWTWLGPAATEVHPIALECVTARANIALHRGDLEQALALAERVLAARRRALERDDPSLHSAIMHLGSIRLRCGDALAAHALFQEALELARAHPPAKLGVQQARTMLATAKYELGDLPGAIALLRETLASYPSDFPAAQEDVRNTKVNLAAALAQLGDWASAKALFEEVLATLRASLGEAHFEVRNLELDLAQVLLHEGRPSEARALLERALPWYESHGKDRFIGLSDARALLAQALAALGEDRLALEIERRNHAALLRSVPEHHPALSQSSVRLAQLLARRGEIEEARALAKQSWQGQLRHLRAAGAALSLRAHSEGWRDLAPTLHTYLALSPSAEDALEAVVAARGVTEQAVRARRQLRAAAARDPRLAELCDRARFNIDAYARAFATASDALTIDHARQASEQSEEALLQTAARAQLLGDSLHEWSASEIVAPLGQHSAAIVTITYADHRRAREPATESVCALVVSRTAVRRIDLADAAGLDLKCRKLNRSLAAQGVDQRTVDDAVRAVSAAMAEVLAAIPAGVERLYVAPDGALASIPWELLALADRARLHERHQVIYVDNLTPGSSRTPRVGTAALVAFGGIDYGSRPSPDVARTDTISARGEASFAPLNGSLAEVEAVARLFRDAFPDAPTVLVASNAATRERFTSTVAGARYLHVASHAYVESERFWQVAVVDAPVRSARQTALGMDRSLLAGVVFAGANTTAGDDIGHATLTAAELAALDLSQCELAVLSACETNVGPRQLGEAVTGLNRALHLAGAAHTITSLWRVEDTATKLLFEEFYRNLWQKRMSVASALRTAREALAAAGFGAQAWAAFIHYAAGLETE